ncbi:TIGR00341 family protein [Patescibacteria group bacterium]
MLILFKNLTNEDKSAAVERLITGSTPSQDFFFMIILSILTATFGLLLNDIAIIIGSMLIAPILYPILSLSLGIIMSDPKLISRSFYTVVKSLGIGILAATLVTLLFSSQLTEITAEIAARTQPSLPSLIIAVTAGLAASFALVKPKLSETLPGIAISVALVPPIAVVGIGIAKLNLIIVTGALLLFLVNFIGVVFASMLTFSLMNFYIKRGEAKETVDKEDKKVELEKEAAERAVRAEEVAPRDILPR